MTEKRGLPVRFLRLIGSVRTIPAAVTAVAITVSSSVPGSSLPRFPFPHFDKLVHFLFYSALAFGWALIPGGERWKRYGAPLILFPVIGTGLFGAFDEWWQLSVPGRVPSWGDWATDLLAGGVVSVLFYLRFRRRERRGSHGR